MAPSFSPSNSDLPSSYENPGVYFQLRATGAGAAAAAPSKRALIWGHKLASGSGQFNSPIRCPGLQQAFLYAGRGSDAVRAFQAGDGLEGQSETIVLNGFFDLRGLSGFPAGDFRIFCGRAQHDGLIAATAGKLARLAGQVADHSIRFFI